MNTNAANSNSSSDAGVDGTTLAALSLSSPTAKTQASTGDRTITTAGDNPVNIGGPKQDSSKQENPPQFQKSRRDQGTASGGSSSYRGRFPRRPFGRGGRQPGHPFSTPAQFAQSEGTHSGASSVPSSHKYIVRRRPPPRAEKIKPNDVYVCLKTSYKAHCEKCIKLLDGKFSEIHVHALSDAIPVAINVAIELKKFFKGTVDFTTRTETVNLIDDLIPTDDVTAPTFARRKISAIDIHVFRTLNIP